MTYLFFIKLLDDSQVKKEANAKMFDVEIKDPVFKTGTWLNPETNKEVPYINLRWSNFKNFDTTTMLSTVQYDVFVFIKNISSGKDSSFSRFMSDTIFMIPNERTLSKIVDGISDLDLTNKDSMGDVYEYILGKMAASGTNGQFRTPRHIIRIMIHLLNPTLKDVLCDPAMGSAGFIVEAAKYMSVHYHTDLLNMEHGEHYRKTMFYGFDTDQTMLRIGAMNMMLHSVDNPNIEWQGSLSNDNKDKAIYTKVFANPPFKGSLDHVSAEKGLLTLAKIKQTKLLFFIPF